MNADRFMVERLEGGLRWLASLGGPQPSAPARVFLTAVAGQESDWSARYQGQPSTSPGPARGFWQFERGGGVVGVMTHAQTKGLAARCCVALDVAQRSDDVWRALEGNDQLAAAFARLLLWTDPHTIPVTQDAAWACYLRLWRPGRPHPQRWPAVWAQAQAALAGAPA